MKMNASPYSCVSSKYVLIKNATPYHKIDTGHTKTFNCRHSTHSFPHLWHYLMSFDVICLLVDILFSHYSVCIKWLIYIPSILYDVPYIIIPWHTLQVLQEPSQYLQRPTLMKWSHYGTDHPMFYWGQLTTPLTLTCGKSLLTYNTVAQWSPACDAVGVWGVSSTRWRVATPCSLDLE